MTSVYTILHPTDFSRCADKAFKTACALARDRGAQLIVLHVMEPVRLSGEWLAVELFSPPKKERWEALRRLQARGVQIQPVVRKGAPAAEIVSLAREVPCDLIVMGMRDPSDRGPLAVGGGVAADVARLAHCPVLGMKLPAADAAGRTVRRRVETTGVPRPVKPLVDRQVELVR